MRKISLLILLCLCMYANEFRIGVGVSLAPYAYFVKKIGGDFVEVVELVPHQKNPNFYDLTYDQVKQIKNLKLLMGAGAAYEKKWFDRLQKINPPLRIINFSSKCDQALCYCWLSFKKVREIAQEIAYYLRMIDLKNAQNYKNNLKNFLDELDIFQEELRGILNSSDSYVVVDYSEVWKSLADELDLKYILFQDMQKSQRKWCIVTPFDLRKQIAKNNHLALEDIVVIDPFAQDWKNIVLSFVKLIDQENRHGK